MLRALPYVAALVLLGGILAAWGVWNRQALDRLPAYAPPAKRHRQPMAEGELRLVVMGDWGSGRPAQVEVAQAMEKTASEIGGFHAGLLLGDNFHDHGVKNIADPLLRRHFEQLYDTPHLAYVRWYAVLGEHDYDGDPQAQLRYTGRGRYGWNLPHEYYREDMPTFGETLVTLLALDTNLRFERWDAQLRWLERELERLADEPQMVVVMTHHPLVSYSTEPERVHDWMRERVAPILARHDGVVDLVVAGHAHCMELIEVDGLRQVVVGTGGQGLHGVEGGEGSRFHASTFGFGVLRIRPGQLDFAFRDRSGAVLYEWSYARVR